MNSKLYGASDVAFRQYMVSTLEGIKHAVEGLDDMDEDNIVVGKSIMGIDGTFSKEDDSPVKPEDLALGKVAFVNGKKVVGKAIVTKFELTIADDDGTGTGAVTVDGQPYSAPIELGAGEIVKLKATAASGSEFTKWTVDSVDSDEGDEFDFEMPGDDCVVSAVFDLE